MSGSAHRVPVRRLYLHASPGETRGVVTLDGRAERFLISREGDATPRLGAVYAGRVKDLSPRMGLARIDIAGAVPATLRLGPGPPPDEGALVEADVAAEPAGGKAAALRWLRPHDGDAPGLLKPAPDLKTLLREFSTEAVISGEAALEVVDQAQALALAPQHRLADGGLLTIEPTRALVAVDVDAASATASVNAIANLNLAALATAARLLRLKALAGLVAIDLVGFPRDKARLHAAALEAFACDGEGVIIGPLSRFGVLELSKPRGRQPVHEQLLGQDGQPTLRTRAQALVRDLQRQGRADPGALLEAVCAPALARELRPLAQRLGPRFRVREALGYGPADADIATL